MKSFVFVVAAIALSFLACPQNSAPNPPGAPAGPQSGVVGQALRLASSAVDPDGDSARLRFDWDDGDTSEWSALADTGAVVSDTHSWPAAGDYRVAAQAEDVHGLRSGWGAFTSVHIDSTEVYPARVLATVPVGQQPSDVAATPNGRYVYVTCNGSNFVTVVRTSDNQVLANVDVSANPMGIAVTANGDRVFVACSDGRVKVIATAGNQIETEVNLGLAVVPFGLALSGDGEHLYVSDMVFGRLIVVNATSYAVETTVAVGLTPYGVTVAAGYVYVANFGAGTVTVVRISDNQVVATVNVGPAPYWITSSPDGQYVYVAVSGGIEVKVIRTSDNSVSSSLSVGQNPYGVAVLPGGAYVYAANHGSNTVAVVRASDGHLVANVAVEAGPTSVRVSVDGQYVYVTNGVGNSVSVIGY